MNTGLIFRGRYKKVTHCLFDLDGTILDTEALYHKLIKQLCNKYGRVYTKELEFRMYGVTDREVSKSVVKELKMPVSVDEFETQLTIMTESRLPTAPLKEGVERLLSHLYKNNVPLAMATNSTEHTVRLHVTSRPKLFEMFHHKVSATDPDVDRGKPHPDIYLIAAARFPDNPKPIQCLVFEDSLVGVQAATEAGMQVVMIPENHIRTKITSCKATLMLRSLLEFKPEMFGLPPFSDGENK